MRVFVKRRGILGYEPVNFEALFASRGEHMAKVTRN